MIAGLRLHRPALRGLALASLLAACWQPERQVVQVSEAAPAAPKHAVAAIAPPATSARAPAAAPLPAALRPGPAPLEPAPAPAGAGTADPFAATSWAPPPAPAVAAAAPPPAPAAAAVPPPAPAAPPNPFVYVGSYQDGPRQTVILLRGEQLLLVQQGDTIDHAYRLDRIAPGGLVMTYLPLQLRQSLPIADPV